MQDGLRNVHSSMIQRCENPKRQQYSRYGGRGIKVCEEWHNYEIFRKWALENGYRQNRISHTRRSRAKIKGNGALNYD